MRKVLFFFGILDDDDIEWFVQTGARRRVSRGTVLIREGEPADSMFLVIDGVLSVSVAALSGKEIAALLAGELVGEMSFVDSRPPSASVQAKEDTIVLAIPRDLLKSKLEADSRFAARFYRALAVFLADRLRTTTSRMGYGKNAPPASQDDNGEDLDPDVLEQLSIAGSRFDQLQRRLRGLGVSG